MLETYGTGNFAFGYFGGLMDNATGLMYIGNGKYYDPATGRFLNRDAKPNNSNPYVPFDPMGALFAPLGLMALVYGNKKKGSKWAVLLVVLSFAIVTGMTLSGCGNNNLPQGTVTATGTIDPVTGIAVGTATFSDGTTVTGTIVTTPSAPSATPIPCPCAGYLTHPSGFFGF
jgi:RHS repeat-associated protein